MRKSCLPRMLILAIVVLGPFGATGAAEEAGLLLVFHGSASAEWNRPMLQFAKRAAQRLETLGAYQAVRAGMLEMAEPTIGSAVADLRAAGCRRIVAVPLFIAHSGHTLFDVPAVLGIYWSPHMAATLAEEGIEPVRADLPITLTCPLSQGTLLRQYVLDQVKKLSRSPEDEAIVVLAHGDADHRLPIDRLLRRIVTYCCAQSGIEYGDWAYVAVGQEYGTNGIEAIDRAARCKRRVLVVALYVGLSAHDIHQRYVARRSHAGLPHLFENHEVVFSRQRLIDHPALLDWVVQTASEAAQGASGTSRRETDRFDTAHTIGSDR